MIWRELLNEWEIQLITKGIDEGIIPYLETALREAIMLLMLIGELEGSYIEKEA